MIIFEKEENKMIDRILVAGTAQAISDILTERKVPFKFRNDEENDLFQKVWDELDPAARRLAYRQARPAVERIFSLEDYVFVTDGEPLVIRFNFLDSSRELAKDSFGEILLERPDLKWRISISIKNEASVLSRLPVADRELDTFNDKVVSVANDIDDFGERIFGVPCSNDYFEEVNAILNKIAPFDSATWNKLVTDEKFAYDNLITPMLEAIGRELPHIFRFHPEAPAKLIDFFYGSIDYYFIHPVEQLEVTRIGSVNPHGDLGRIPGSGNHTTPQVRIPTELLDVRFATGKYGELSGDTLRLSFDGGWAVCLKVSIVKTPDGGHNFALSAFLPITPFGSYRDQVAWAPEA